MTAAVIHSSQTDSAGKVEITPRFTDRSEAPGGSGGPSKSLRKRVGGGEDDDESTPNKKPKLLNKSQVSGAHAIQPQTPTASGQEGDIIRMKALQEGAFLNLLTNITEAIEAFLKYEQFAAGRQIARECSRALALPMPTDLLEVFVQAYLQKMWVEKKIKLVLMRANPQE